MSRLKVHFINEYNNKRFSRVGMVKPGVQIYAGCGMRMNIPETRLRVSEDPQEVTCLNCHGSFEYKLAKAGELKPGFRFKSGETKVAVKARWVHITMPDVLHVSEDMRQNFLDVSYTARFRYLKSRDVYAYTREPEADKMFLQLMDRFGFEFESEQDKTSVVKNAFNMSDWEAIEFMINDQFGL